MGYNMYLMDYSVHIKKEDFADALNAVKAAFPHDKDVQNSIELEEVMYEFYYYPEHDNQGNICDICFDGEKLQDDDIFWSALAPYMEDGDFIEMEGDDFNRWRWVFKDGVCREIQSTITWEDEQNGDERLQRA